MDTLCRPLGASPALQAKLQRLGLCRVVDLLFHFPLRYEDETRVVQLAEAPWQDAAQFELTVQRCDVVKHPRRQLLVLASDQTATVNLRFFSFYPNLQAMMTVGARIRAFGQVRSGFSGLEMVHPRVQAVGPDTPFPECLTPIYPTTHGLGQASLVRLISKTLQTELLQDTLLPAERGALELLPLQEAVQMLHHPPKQATRSPAILERAWRRVRFDEVLAQQLSLRRAVQLRRACVAPALPLGGRLAAAVQASLPFALTGAQQRAVAEIGADLTQPFPMHRLLQGDVGAGKTLVAALVACQAIEAGWQVALMAPTEILAEQHYQKLAACLSPLGVQVAWLTGSLKTSEKRSQRASIAANASLVVGTHALIQSDVDFARLGLVIIDEQHRFGVAQRLALRKKGMEPHQLMMTATPIPRSLAMSYYADLSVTLLDELPPGRTPVRTRLVQASRQAEVIAFVEAQLSQGRQAYWVCPLIEESETLQLQTAEACFAALLAALPQRRVGLVHGRLKAAEKQAVMAAFVAGALDVLVATTVIEVGVDVPNASLMVIEHAERFGLSQLHQLRGRVGRGAAQSTCILLYAQPLSEQAKERLKIMFEHTDGFEIARRDLALRGPGEFVGSRQSGVPLLRYADLERDVDLIEAARDLADMLLVTDPARAALHQTRWLGSRAELLNS